MAGPPELFNFVNKFLNLLNCGQSARLTVESHGGKATVNLQLDLKPCPPHVEAQQGRPQRQHAGPSRLRRHAARAQARDQAASEAASSANVAAQAAKPTPSTADTAATVIAEEATSKDTNENDEINSATEQVTIAEEHATIEEVAASNTIGESGRFNEDLKIRDDTIEELNEKVRNLSKENIELNDRIMVTQMFYDGFRDEMRDRFGYDSDEDAEEHYQELLKKDTLEKVKYSCDKCVFSSESKVGLKVHGTKKHRGQV